jgi:hypothetical protein
MGSFDRTIRIVIAAMIAVLIFNGSLSGIAAIILGALAVIFLATSLIGSCPLYLPFGLSTCKK